MRIEHGRVSLELHEPARADGPSLLLLHPLYESSAMWSEVRAAWPGRVYALDFCGHGLSGWLKGGAYSPELLCGDADAALAAIGGNIAVAGAGLGAYVTLLLAGARSQEIAAALLLPGAGLAGGGVLPNFRGPHLLSDVPVPGEPAGVHDPMVRVLDRDIRPPDYAASFARAARRLLLAEDGQPRPPWWEACRASPAAERVVADAGAALKALARP
jgi:pimeloyl-ACP methyl ester carboxylesterase